MGSRSTWTAMVLAMALIGSGSIPESMAEGDRSVSVQELFRAGHRLEVDSGTRVVFADSHFDRVWFPRTRGPVVQRTDAGLSASFDTPGEYRGSFTVVGGHGTTDVYPLTVVVK